MSTIYWYNFISDHWINFPHMEKLENHPNLLTIDALSGGFPEMAGEHGKYQSEDLEREP